MCDCTDAYISGAWHGGLAVLFIVAGLLGWPQTRFILTVLFRRPPRKPIGKPVGSLGASAAPFWNQYGVHRSERGFAIGPILYMLALIGVIGGVMFSSNMQILKSNVTVQNSVTAKSDHQAAATTLAAQSVFGTDGLTLCPPRSIHLTEGGVCAAAPIGLTQFGDLPASELSQLPSGYANAASTGSPTEVGVYAPGAGTRMLDPYGHLYIYCRWENQRSNPGAPAFVLLSAGEDGVLQTTCGSSAAQNDDYLMPVSVGEAINRSAVWQTQGSTGVSYGASGSQVYIDNGGNMNVTSLTTSNAATIGTTLSANSLNALNATVTGVATVNTLNGSSATFSGPLSATNGSFTGITATGTITGETGNFTSLNALTLTVTGAATAASLTTSGDVTAKDLIASMNVSGNNGTFSIVNAGSAVITNGITAASLTTTGDINAEDLIATNNVSGATGTFTTGNLTTATIATGNITSINAASENVTGDTTMNNLTVTGTLTANNFSASGGETASTGTFSTLNVTNANISSVLTANSETVTNGLSAGSISTTGTLTADNAVLGALTVIGGNIETSGTDMAATGYFSNLTVTENATIGGQVGIGNTSPGALLDLGLNGTTTGTLRLESGGTGYVQIQPSNNTSSYTLTLPSAAPAANGYVLSSTTAGVLSWIAGSNTSLSSLSGATTGTNIDNGNYTQNWTWNSLGSNTALSITTTDLTSGTLLNVQNTSGGDSTGYAGYFENYTTGAGYALYALTTGTGNTGYGIYAANPSASGWAGYFNGALGVSTAETIGTSLTTPLIIGGNGTGSTLTLESTSVGGKTDSIAFKTGTQSTAMTITTTGSIGIGTTTPGEPFDLYSSNSLSNGILALFQDSGNVNTAFQVQNSQEAWQFSVRNSTDPNPGGFDFYYSPNGSSDWTTPMVITTSGHVGIGTTTPGDALTVYAYNTTPLYAYTSYGSPAAYFSTGNGGAIEAVGGGSGATALFATVASGSSVRSVILIGQPNGNTGDLLEVETGGGTTLSAIKYNGAFSVGTQSSANMLDVYGSAAIGKSYAGSISAPSNGLIVQGNVGVGTSSPTSVLDVNGEIQAGNSGANCTASNAGAIRYNSTNQLMQYCNGSAWGPFNPACMVGAAVGSGYCAGQIAGKNLIVAPSGCAASASLASQCSGADIQMWYQNNGNSNNNTMIYGGDGVAAQTAALAYYASIGRAAPTNNIAEYCNSLTLDGKTWHAPSVSELEIIVTQYLEGNLSAVNFGTGEYWSANDDYANNAAVVTFSTGTVSLQNNSYVSEAIRCVTLE